jgi:hypothetical protein
MRNSPKTHPRPTVKDGISYCALHRSNPSSALGTQLTEKVDFPVPRYEPVTSSFNL